MHGFDLKEAMVLIEPDRAEGTISTEHVLETIDNHASETALILLPGIQFYTGQYFDMRTITKHAHSKGILIGWDCAHAAGNVDLKLHDWDVDFAVWCNYKYLNSGPGAIAAIFVHEKHGRVDLEAEETYRPRLCGWWGADKETRFQMENSKTIIASGRGAWLWLTHCQNLCRVLVQQAISFPILVPSTSVPWSRLWRSLARHLCQSFAGSLNL